ncbi:hypothetical protein CO115_03380 [Candidatus Falkowbacteria bacterium CG_4_9_14_3_um_filter_36_9]|nr:MAG: hypothetical protein CO115_03380 [Candidatus Falkowbacteria bacterium CG_4_9_14_3_um_filter_36_9]
MEQDLMEKLNKEQFEAVRHNGGPLLIVAGAGTGKTTVITQKIAYIINQGLAGAEEILALTFTEKAAGEMEERVDRLFPLGYTDLWISTFHSFAERILKNHGLDIGLPDDFKLLNEFEQWALIRKNLDKFNLDYYQPAGNPTKFIKYLIKHFSRLKDEDIAPADYLQYGEELKGNLDGTMSGGKGKFSLLTKEGTKGRSRGTIQSHPKTPPNPPLRKGRENNEDDDGIALTKEIAIQEVARINEVANAYHIYQNLLLEAGALDFGDLINYCLKLFRARPMILEKYRGQFKYILVDEFQDTNWAQYELIKMLLGPKKNLIVCADDDQSIYRFRGASMSNVLEFIKDFPDAKKVTLVKNYRSQQNILDLSYNFIQLNNPNRLEYQLNKQRSAGKKKPSLVKLNKRLIAQTNGRGEVEAIKGEDLYDEIKLVIKKIIELEKRDEEATWNDFAILIRANDAAKEFSAYLELAGVPYQFLAFRGLYAKPIIMDIIAYLKLLDDYHESRAMFRVLNIPVFNFSYQELVNFNYWANKKNWSLYEVFKSAANFIQSKKILDKINAVLNLIAKHSIMARERIASEIIIAFLEDSGYLKYLTKADEAKTKEPIAYLNQFMKRAQAFQKGSDDKSVKAFLNELAMEIDSGDEGSIAPDGEAGPEAVKIMTVHGGKGLEFKYVFIVNMVDKRFPTIPRQEMIKIPDALIKEILPAGDIHLEEERRLFYVAMTRAKEGLYFSWSPDYGGARKKKPSRFLEEIGLVSKKNLIGDESEKIFNSSRHRDPASRRQFSIFKQFPISNRQTNHKLEILNPKSEIRNFSMPTYFSYTQLAAFSHCPYQYRFAHILRVPARGKAVFSFGQTMHATMQKVFELLREKTGFDQGDLFAAKTPNRNEAEKINITLAEIIKIYEKSWIDDWFASKKQKEEYKTKGKVILKEFFIKYKDNWPRTLYIEKGFKMKIKSQSKLYMVRGKIDRIDESDGALRIIDYKTGLPKQKLTIENKEQLLIYQMAAADLFKQPISSVVFYYLENNSEEEFLGTADELDKIKNKVINTIEEIAKGEFPPRPSNLCAFCDFFDICEFRKT